MEDQQPSTAVSTTERPEELPKLTCAENERINGVRLKKAEDLIAKGVPSLLNLTFEALELKRPDTKLCYFDTRDKQKVWCLCSQAH